MSQVKAETVFLGAHVPADLKEQVETIAAHGDHSVSWVVRQALKRYVSDFAPEDARPSTGAAA